MISTFQLKMILADSKLILNDFQPGHKHPEKENRLVGYRFYLLPSISATQPGYQV